MAGVASDRRWPRLVRGSAASVQGLRVISVQLCSHRCAPRRAAGGLQASASAPESLMGAQHCRTACRPTQAQLTGRIIRTTSIEPAAAKAGFATTIAIRRRPQADWPECTCPEGVPQLSGGGRTARPFCHGWCQWVVWGCSSAVIPHRTARPQTRECKWGAMCNMRQGAMRARRPGGGDRWRTSVASSLVTPEVVSSGSETGRGAARGTVEFWGSAEPPPYIYEEKVGGGSGRVLSLACSGYMRLQSTVVCRVFEACAMWAVRAHVLHGSGTNQHLSPSATMLSQRLAHS
jgi:hypothetical protein